MKRDWSKWWKKAGVRALKTMAEVVVAMIPAAASIKEVDWLTILSTAALSGVVSLLISVKGLPELSGANEKE